MKITRTALLAVFLVQVSSINPVFAEVPDHPDEPSPKETAEFFGTEKAPPEQRRRLAENGCKYGWYAISRGYFYSAEGAFSKAIEIDPACACGYFGMARVKKIQQDAEGCSHFYREAIKRDPSLASAENKAKVEREDIPKSGRNPHSDAIASAKMGWDSFNKKDFDKAVSFFEFAIKQEPSYAPGYFGIAYVNSVQNKLDKAEHYYRETIKRDSSFPPAHANLAYALLLQDKEVEAKAELEDALKLDPKQGDAVMNFAYYYADKKNWDQAKRYFLDACQRGAQANKEAAEVFKKHGMVAPAQP